jgi:hypothetical protein
MLRCNKPALLGYASSGIGGGEALATTASKMSRFTKLARITRHINSGIAARPPQFCRIVRGATPKARAPVV